MTDMSKHSLSLMFESLDQSATCGHVAFSIAFIARISFRKVQATDLGSLANAFRLS